MGRVVGLEGAVLAGASVELVGYEESPPDGSAFETTDSEGHFRFPSRPSSELHYLVVRTEQSAHTYPLFRLSAEERPPERDVGDLHIAPDREVELVIQCAGPLIPETPEGDLRNVFARFTWMGHELVTGVVWPIMGFNVGNREIRQRRVSPGYTIEGDGDSLHDDNARGFQRFFRLPIGTHRLRISGPCTKEPFVRQVEVPATGPVETIRIAIGPTGKGHGQ